MKNRFFMFIAIVAIIGVSMASCASFKVVDVEWDTLEGPSKARQYLGISNSEVKVYAHYENGDRKLASAGSLKYDKDKVGVQTVTVTVGGTEGGTFETEVMELTGIGILSPPSKTAYKVGESLDTAGLKIKGMWRDMPEMEIPIFQLLTLTHSGFDSNTPGTKVITNTWRGKTATYTVTVTAAATPAPAAPAASQPSQPAQQQPSTQPPAQQGQMDQRLVGTWRMVKIDGANTGTSTCIYNANGTGSLRVVVVSTATDFRIDTTMTFTWSVNGNRLTENRVYETGFTESFSYTYSVSGNTLTTQGDDIGNLKGATNVYTKQ